MGRQRTPKSSDESVDDAKDRKETLLQRRERVLGTKSLRYIDSQKATSPSGDKRRSQILQAQRIHRQRTLDYIAELEAEVFRLRESENALSSAVQDKDCQLTYLVQAGPQPEPDNTITVNVLIQCLNGQVAPGLFIKPPQSPDDRKPSLVQPLDHFSIGLDSWVAEEPWSENTHIVPSWVARQTIRPSLESHDSLTRMLFLNFSENIAPTMVPSDGDSNGYRTMLLPLAHDDDAVRWALLAASANHLRFRRPKLTKLALNFQAAAIDKLWCLSKSTDCARTSGSSTLGAIILLLINGMMNGNTDFQMMLDTAKSWIAAIANSGTLQEPRAPIEEFLHDQFHMIQLYAQPLLDEQTVIRCYSAFYSPDLSAGDFTYSSKMHEIFASLESAIKQACAIYSYHVANNGPPDNIEDLLETLKDTVGGIPNHTPGENALAWVYFIAAAESSTATKRQFFAKRLMGIYERGTVSDVTTSFNVLHQIWNCQVTGDSWAKVQMQMPLVIK